MTLVVNARFLTQPLTGVQRYAIECSIQIKQISNDVIFVSPPGILHHDIARLLGVKIIGKRNGHYWEQVELYHFLKTNRSPPLLCLANSAPLRYNNNFITIHDLAFMHNPRWNAAMFSLWYRFLIPFVAKRARHIFTVSNTIKKEILQYLRQSDNRVSVTYNGLPSSFLNYTSGIKRPQILSVGSFNRRKNHHQLIKAFIQSGLGSTYNLVIAGSADKIYKETGLDITKAGNHGIQIINRPSDQELIHLYQTSEILMSLSAYEGFGIPVLEGIYFNCKILCSDIPTYRELFNNYVYFCDPDQIASISDSLARITDVNATMPQAGVDFFSKYSYEKSAIHILNIINKPEP